MGTNKIYLYQYLIAFYQENCRGIAGATEALRWCQENGIKVATGTGFHKEINIVIMESLVWGKDGLISCTKNLGEQRGWRECKRSSRVYYGEDDTKLV